MLRLFIVEYRSFNIGEKYELHNNLRFIAYLGRARKCEGWDNSNMTNIIRVFAHLATHPDDFSRFQYEDGKKPFWYLSGDEFSDIVRTRPNKKDKK